MHTPLIRTNHQLYQHTFISTNTIELPFSHCYKCLHFSASFLPHVSTLPLLSFLFPLSLSLFSLSGPVSVRSHPAPETGGNTIGLEAIIRKALMGKYDEQGEDRPPTSMGPTSTTPSGAEGHQEESYSGEHTLGPGSLGDRNIRPRLSKSSCL